MTVSAIRITYFQADKIACTGTQRQSSPYRITTYKGPELGLLGAMPAVLSELHEMDSPEAANADLYENSFPNLFERLTGLRRQG